MRGHAYSHALIIDVRLKLEIPLSPLVGECMGSRHSLAL